MLHNRFRGLTVEDDYPGGDPVSLGQGSTVLADTQSGNSFCLPGGNVEHRPEAGAETLSVQGTLESSPEGFCSPEKDSLFGAHQSKTNTKKKTSLLIVGAERLLTFECGGYHSQPSSRGC